jgi:hypothetical protein
MKIKTLSVITALLILMCSAAFAQSPTPLYPTDVAGIAVHYQPVAAPQIGGMAVYAHRITDNSAPTYSFSLFEATSIQRSPFRVGLITETGIAQYTKEVLGFHLYALAMAGAVTNATDTGTHVGFSGSVGTLAYRPIGKGFAVSPYVLYTRPGGVPQQWAVGVLLSYGK